MIFVVLVAGHVNGVYSSAVNAHLQAKPLNETVELCRLNSEVLKLEPAPCDHEWIVESQYGTKSERVCKTCDVYQSDLSPCAVICSDGSGSGPCE